MIVFDLECLLGHAFEGWFDSAEAFEEQADKGFVSCPVCGHTSVRRVMSPVAVKKSASKPERPEAAIDYRRLAREVVNYIRDHFEDVGPKFATEALKIHHGAAERRNIKGVASDAEEKLLKDEGVEFFKLPAPKTDDEKKN